MNRAILQEEEVDAVKWFDFEECVELVRQNSIPHCIMMEELEMLEKGIEGYLKTAEVH